MEEVYNFIKKDIELKSDDIIVIGVSGGPDSMALLYIMNEFKNKIGFKIVCAHVNHNKRVESEQEKIDLENYCKENDIIFEYIKITKWGDDNFHNEARSVRYNFFEELVENYGAKYLMTAHHGDEPPGEAVSARRADRRRGPGHARLHSEHDHQQLQPGGGGGDLHAPDRGRGEDPGRRDLPRPGLRGAGELRR